MARKHAVAKPSFGNARLSCSIYIKRVNCWTPASRGRNQRRAGTPGYKKGPSHSIARCLITRAGLEFGHSSDFTRFTFPEMVNLQLTKNMTSYRPHSQILNPRIQSAFDRLMRN